ncbi:MAG TPA: amylo-alpha-1,6-glucosidase [Ktedonobacteraceae bacterium]|jgi:glycogen debranching enzyme|nr:amylo-alpha-1,6-glucosidase [Ktedonobacteraceae bacterium]
MAILFDRNVCRDLNETITREWLMTNGQGGYAAGTIAGTLTRMQHGLLVAPIERDKPHLLLAKIDEEIIFDQRTYYLGTNEYRDGVLNPAGFVHLESFRLEEGFPVFTYHLGGIDGIMLEKRIWMPKGRHTTYIQYRVLRTTSPEEAYHGNASWGGASRTSYKGLTRYREYPDASQRVLSLTLLPFAAYRPFDQPQYGSHDWNFSLETHTIEESGQSVAGCTIRARDGAHPYHIFAVGHRESQTTFLPTGVWYWKFLRRHDREAGKAPTDDLYLPGVFRTRLWPGEEAVLTLIVTAEDLSGQVFQTRQLTYNYEEAVNYQRSLLQSQRYFGESGEAVHTHPVLPFNGTRDSAPSGEEFLRLLMQAGDRFVRSRVLSEEKNRPSFLPENRHVSTLFSGFYSLHESTRDMLIALPGILLAARRYPEARGILSTLARYFKQGLLPDRMPDKEHPLREEDYSSADTTLWYFYALDSYLRATRDYELLDDLYERLAESIERYTQGTLCGIHVDPEDGLLYAGQASKAMTWMNACVQDAPVTPRVGKAVEVNALWYNALSLMHEWSQHLYNNGRIPQSHHAYREAGEACRQSFNERFWYSFGGYLYDVIDSSGKPDTHIRPNQLFALSLRYPVLDEQYWRPVFQVVTKHLLTPFGLRTLSPDADEYVGHIKERIEDQQHALHQGSAWPWLLGPYVDALIRVEGSNERENTWRKGLQLLNPFREQLLVDMLGIIASVYDGDTPQQAHNEFASAISIGELLRVYKLVAHLGVRFPERALPV